MTEHAIDKLPPQTIVGLKITNLLRVKVVALRPGGQNVILGGDNDQGKSSIMNVIAFTIGGKRLMPDKLLHGDETKGESVIETEDLWIRCSVTPSGTKLQVKWRRDGQSIPQQQTALSRLYNILTFDPIEFMQMDKEKQVSVLRDLLGIDLTRFDKNIEAYMEQRKNEKKLLDLAESSIRGKELHPAMPENPVDVAQVMANLSRGEELNKQRENLTSTTTSLGETIALAEGEVNRLTVELDVARAHFERLKQEKLKADDLLKVHPALVDCDVFRNAIRDAGSINDKMRENTELNAAIKNRQQLAALCDELTGHIETEREAKRQELAKVEMPIVGLSITDEDILLDGVPIKQAGTATQVRLSASIGIMMNPKLRIMFARNASLLDAESWKALSNLCAQHKIQIWYEVVGDRDDVSVLIDDGRVAEDRMIEMPDKVATVASEPTPKAVPEPAESTMTTASTPPPEPIAMKVYPTPASLGMEEPAPDPEVVGKIVEFANGVPMTEEESLIDRKNVSDSDDDDIVIPID